MSFPITVPILTLEIKSLPRSDTEPTPPEGYKVVLLGDLGYTKLWIVFKVTGV